MSCTNLISIEGRIAEVLRGLEKYYHSNFGVIHPEEGKFLQILIELSNAKNVLEIGTSIGVSTLWMCRGLLKTGGKIISIERMPDRVKLAKKNIFKAGKEVENIITLIEGDVRKAAPGFKGLFDMMLFDGAKWENLEYLKLLLPLMKEGGVIVAHDAVYEEESIKDYLASVRNHSQLETVIINTKDEGYHCGMALSYKKKAKKEPWRLSRFIYRYFQQLKRER